MTKASVTHRYESALAFPPNGCLRGAVQNCLIGRVPLGTGATRTRRGGSSVSDCGRSRARRLAILGVVLRYPCSWRSAVPAHHDGLGPAPSIRRSMTRQLGIIPVLLSDARPRGLRCAKTPSGRFGQTAGWPPRAVSPRARRECRAVDLARSATVRAKSTRERSGHGGSGDRVRPLTGGCAASQPSDTARSIVHGAVRQRL
jgi:hypothetical protein